MRPGGEPTPAEDILSAEQEDRRAIRRLINRFSKSLEDVFFIQVGSSDGAYLDPLHTFIQRDRWSGILVEPVGYVFEQLIENYRGHENLVFENAAICDHSGKRDFHYIRQNDELPRWCSQLGSFRRDVILTHAGRIPDIESHLVKEPVECLTFDGLLNKHGVEKVDLLHVDAEGYDYEILKQFELDRFCPGLVLYEHKHLGEYDRAACESLFTQRGYEIIRKDQDTVALKR